MATAALITFLVALFCGAWIGMGFALHAVKSEMRALVQLEIIEREKRYVEGLTAKLEGREKKSEPWTLDVNVRPYYE